MDFIEDKSNWVWVTTGSRMMWCVHGNLRIFNCVLSDARAHAFVCVMSVCVCVLMCVYVCWNVHEYMCVYVCQNVKDRGGGR